jgi:hypothetical protein
MAKEGLVKASDLFLYPKYWAHLDASLITMNRNNLIIDDAKAYKYKNEQYNKDRGGQRDDRKGR